MTTQAQQKLADVLLNYQADLDAPLLEKATKWTDAKLAQMVTADEATRLLASKEIVEFFKHFYHYLDMGPSQYWADMLELSQDQIDFELTLRRAFIESPQVAGFLTAADFDRE